ncbi:MAG: S9 family peptidase [Gemmatimonadaceae bacterium]|nr:S9 family peptidase [Gemmatimonadaceae bacterium]
MRISVQLRRSLLCLTHVLTMCSLAVTMHAQRTREATPRDTAQRGARRETYAEPLDMFEQQRLWKQFSDLSLFTQLGPEMIVRKIRYAGADGMIIPGYFFAPRDTTVKRPAIIMVHGGVHGDFTASYATEVRSLVARGYLVVAPEYRGSTGYGRAHYDAIDYGGKEVEDCIAARDYLAALVPNADLSRVGIMGWSHGGFISIHAVLRRPELFKVAVAHVPVADLPTRIRTHSEAYHKIFADQKGFGGRLEQNPQAYVERSPIAHARKLTVPLLVHAADNDDDVFIVENHALRDSMVAAGMDKRGLYTYREWHNPPGGHSFSRVDTPQARESWRETVAFLDRYLRGSR